MKTGFSKICITPPLGTPIHGYFKARYTKGVLDDLFVRAVAFDDGEKKAVIVALDLCLLTKDFCDEYRKVISEYCNIPTTSVFITCSHTHTGPLLWDDPATGMKAVPGYNEYLKLCIRDAAAYALRDLKESKFYTAEGKAERISFIRRFRMKDGSVQTNPGINNPNVDHALDEPIETVKLLKIVREDAKDIYMVNFGTHSDSIGGDRISADFPGHLCSIIENAIENSHCVFLNAPEGDVNHINPFPTEAEAAISEIDFDNVPRSYEHSKHMARVIAGAVLQICTTAKEVKAEKLSYDETLVKIPSYQQNDKLDEAEKIHKLYCENRTDELPYKGMELTTVVAEAQRIWNLKDGPDSYDFWLSAIKVGDFVFAGIPGEPFTDIGRRIYAGSPFETTILCCLTNAGGTYFPTTKAYDEGGYEARSSKLAPGGDDIIVNGMCDLLKKIK